MIWYTNFKVCSEDYR